MFPAEELARVGQGSAPGSRDLLKPQERKERELSCQGSARGRPAFPDAQLPVTAAESMMRSPPGALAAPDPQTCMSIEQASEKAWEERLLCGLRQGRPPGCGSPVQRRQWQSVGTGHLALPTSYLLPPRVPHPAPRPVPLLTLADPSPKDPLPETTAGQARSAQTHDGGPRGQCSLLLGSVPHPPRPP